MSTSMPDIDDATLILLLEELAEDLRPHVLGAVINNENDARHVTAALLQHIGVGIDNDALLASDDDAIAVGRRLLAEVMQDSLCGATARSLVADPPTTDQLGFEQAVMAAAVLGALITYLQTKIGIRIHRDHRGTKVDF